VTVVDHFGDPLPIMFKYAEACGSIRAYDQLIDPNGVLIRSSPLHENAILVLGTVHSEWKFYE